MGYTDQRDAILVHAKAAALAANSTWTNVAIGWPIPNGKSVRVYYGGERTPVRMPHDRSFTGELVAEVIVCVAFWPLSALNTDGAKLMDDEMYTFKHELRTRVLGDSQLGGKATDLEMSYATPDLVVIGNTRYAIIEAQFATDFTEYPLAP